MTTGVVGCVLESAWRTRSEDKRRGGDHSKFAFESLDLSLLTGIYDGQQEPFMPSHNCGPLHPGNKALRRTSACVHAGLCGLWCPSCLPRASGEVVLFPSPLPKTGQKLFLSHRPAPTIALHARPPHPTDHIPRSLYSTLDRPPRVAGLFYCQSRGNPRSKSSPASHPDA